ncbi:MAG: helix-turn-helix transcriptional regulator [Spirochaetia bacterium]|nr:helix-turn-helix transcriptional regulator [Spirochaetia bacterium]
MPVPNDIEVCSCGIVHPELVERAAAVELPTAELLGTAELFKVLADPTRLRIANALGAAELCVCDLSAVLGMSQSAVSHQLAVLKRARLVRYRRDGKVVHYSLDDDHVGRLVALAREHACERGGAA